MQKPLIVTDLDASFIDEHYQYTEATEAVTELAQRDFPLVFNSSKTLAEIESLAAELNLVTPLIAENGGIIAVPNTSDLAKFCRSPDWEKHDNYHIHFTGLSRAYILSHAHHAREKDGYQFIGFSDMTDKELVSLTGLTENAACLAKQRDATEPILWNDTPERWERFSDFLKSKGIRTLRGGRFIHLMGDADKSDGLKVTHQLYQQCYSDIQWVTVALGDSANDQSMLDAADIAVVIPHADGVKIDVTGDNIIYADHPASKGWNAAILQILSTYKSL